MCQAETTKEVKEKGCLLCMVASVWLMVVTYPQDACQYKVCIYARVPVDHGMAALSERAACPVGVPQFHLVCTALFFVFFLQKSLFKFLLSRGGEGSVDKLLPCQSEDWNSDLQSPHKTWVGTQKTDSWVKVAGKAS